MADVFISYARDDEPVARRVAKTLQSIGLDVWWDANLPAHRAYAEVIERNLKEARAVVVIWSRIAATSQWVRAEADFARHAGKLVQAQIDGTLPPMPFNQIQCADLKGWRGSGSHPGWAKLQGSIASLLSGEEPQATELPEPSTLECLRPYRWWVAAVIALFVTAAAIFLMFPSRVERGKPVIAVLPFKSLDDRDESLAAGMWEDTRQQIGRNPQLIVLGPNTAEQLAKKGPSAAKRAAAYLLEASVRSAGDRIRVNANLVRTRDGAQLWSENFDRRLDDVFALQSEIAREIEGRIRGRLAERGGTKPEHIATSGDVYALYSDARLKIRKRDLYGGYERSLEQLRQVVRMDPNFAPGWATLAVVERIASPSESGFTIAEQAESHARRAIALAPNLAAGHAALALSLGLKGPVAKAEIRRAIELDPNDPESLLWLGNIHNAEGQTDQALEIYSRVSEIEPLWWPAILNRVGVLLSIGDDDAVRQELERVRRLGSRQLSAAIGIEVANWKGDLSNAVQIGLGYIRTAPEDERSIVQVSLWSILLQLGFDDLAWKISPAPPFAPLLRKNDPRGLALVEDMHLSPSQLFSAPLLPTNVARVMLANGRGSELVAKYRALGASPQQFQQRMDPTDFILTAPILAIALQSAGDRDEATAILAAAEASARSASPNPQSEAANLGRIYAVEGRKDEAFSMLSSAVNRGWIPQAPQLLSDIALDPAFASLRADRRFAPLRDRILGTIRRERAELGRIDLNVESTRAWQFGIPR